MPMTGAAAIRAAASPADNPNYPARASRRQA
jgi:hypothetical protein